MTVWSQPLSVLRKRRILQKICAVLVLVVIITTTLFVISQRNASAAPSTVSFTARLKNADGSIVADGFYNIGFKLYGQVSGGSAIWSENYFDENGPTAGQDYRVRVINGYFSVKLGSRTMFDSNVDWDSNLWLTMNIGGTAQDGDIESITWDGEMSPRVELTATPYSMNSGAVGGKSANDLIHNSTDLQNANFNISGTGTASTLQATTGVITPSIDRADAGTLTIGGANATSISLADDVTVAAGKSLTLAGGSTGTRPTSPTEGMMYFDTTTKRLLVYANGKWQSSSEANSKIIAASDSSQTAKDSADYVTDGLADQAEINMALTAAAGGRVYLMEGTYSINSSISIPNNTTLSGAGNSTLIQLSTTSGISSGITNSDTTTGTGVTIRDLQFNGRRDILPSGDYPEGILFNHMGSSTRQGGAVVNVTVVQSRGNGIALNESSDNSIRSSYAKNNDNEGIRISSNSMNNTITGNQSVANGTRGILLIGSGENVVTSNIVTDNTTEGIHTSNGSWGNNISTNVVLRNGGSGIYSQNSSDNNISSNNVQGNTNGIRLDDSLDGVVIGNNISWNSNYGIWFNDSHKGTASSNTISNNSNAGVFLGSSSDNTINSNKISNNGTSNYNNGLTLTSSSRNMISGNVFTDTAHTTTNYSIQITNSASNGNTLSSNSLGGGAIVDNGTSTIQGGQVSSGGNYTIKVPGTINLVGNTAISGAVSATAIQGGSLDTSSANNLTIGGTNASGITLGKTGVSTTVAGSLRANNIDTSSSTALDIGSTNASSINLGQNTTLAMDKTLNVNGETTIKSGTTNSANALRIQNSGGTNLFTVDTANNRVAIGAIDTTGVLLVLDTKTSAGDPTGTNGAMYYNSSSSKFRCYENGAWKDCVTPLPVSVTAQTTTTTDQTTPVDVTNMTFALAANTKYYYKFVIQHESDETTTGSGFGITAPSGVTMSNWCINTTAITNVASPGLGSYCGTGDASATTTGADNPGNYFTSNIEGYIQTGGTAGELKLRFKSETTGKEVTIDPKSFGILQIVQ